MKLKLKKRKLLVNNKISKRIMTKAKRQRLLSKLKITKKKVFCRGIRLEDLKPCARKKDTIDSNYCYIHRKILVLLLNRRDYLFEETRNDRTEDYQFRQFIDEHLNKIFPDEPQKVTECRLSDLIWLNRNDFVKGQRGRCKALNLQNGTSTCQNAIPNRDVYCQNHMRLKKLHAELYHFTYDTRYYSDNWIYFNVYNGKIDPLETFYRRYLEMFIRLEHLTIFQMLLDAQHVHHCRDLVENLARDTTHTTLPEPKSFYKALYMKFCTLGRWCYVWRMEDVKREIDKETEAAESEMETGMENDWEGEWEDEWKNDWENQMENASKTKMKNEIRYDSESDWDDEDPD